MQVGEAREGGRMKEVMADRKRRRGNEKGVRGRRREIKEEHHRAAERLRGRDREGRGGEER